MKSKTVRSRDEIKEKMEDYSELRFDIWMNGDTPSVVISLEPHWDADIASDAMVWWLRYWCIKSIYELLDSMADSTDALLVLSDWLDQIRDIVHKENEKLDAMKDLVGWHSDLTDEKEEVANFFKKLLGKKWK